MFLKELAVTIMMHTITIKAVEFRAKFTINQHDPTKEQSIGSKIVETYPNEKKKGTAFCFKRKN